MGSDCATSRNAAARCAPRASTSLTTPSSRSRSEWLTASTTPSPGLPGLSRPAGPGGRRERSDDDRALRSLKALIALVHPASTKIQWNALAKAAALSGVRPDEVDTASFDHARGALAGAYARRGKPESGPNVRSVFHRLQLTLFHAGKIDTLARPRRPLVTDTGWTVVAPAYERAARRYVEQVTLSLRPSTVKHIEQHLRVFGIWLADGAPLSRTRWLYRKNDARIVSRVNVIMMGRVAAGNALRRDPRQRTMSVGSAPTGHLRGHRSP
jgi:hypothetical protein